jgi:beta-lactam-binding protein with PASTA domain
MQILQCNGTVSQIRELKPDGALVVPDVLRLSETVATNKLSLFDLTPVVAYANKCISPGAVIEESPNPGSQQLPKASVYLTVDNGTNCARK